MINRRFFSAALTGVALAGVGSAPTVAWAQRSGVRVDLSPLQRQGMAGPMLGVISAAIHRAFDPWLAQRGGGAIVRIDVVSMTGYAGGGWGSTQGRGYGIGGGSDDSIAGEVILTDGHGRVVSRFPMHNALAPDSGGAWYDPNVDARRLNALATHWAQWAVRQAS